MFVVLLRFAKNRDQVSQFMDAHRQWIQRGFDDGVFLLVGGLQPNQGGAIVAAGTSLSDLQRRLQEDPFVVNEVAGAEVLEITPSRADERLAFLLE